MKWGKRILIVFPILLLVAGIVLMGYLVSARRQSVEYQFQVDAILGACSVANGGEAVTDPERCVTAEYQDRRTVVVPGNYLALSTFLRRDAMMPFYAKMDRTEALKLTFCGQAELYAMPQRKGERVLIELNTGDARFLIQARGGNLWKSLLACCMEGTYHDENIPLE